MRVPFRLITLVSLCALTIGPGCRHAPVRPTPPVPAPLPPTPPQPDLRSHLLGTWELPTRGGSKEMVFQPNGQVLFKNGLEFYNPAYWSLNVPGQELKLTFPSTPDDKLDIFHMTLGQGVQAFDRRQKQVTYHFDMETWSLNMAGWSYSKQDKPAVSNEAEPVLK